MSSLSLKPLTAERAAFGSDTRYAIGSMYRYSAGKNKIQNRKKYRPPKKQQQQKQKQKTNKTTTTTITKANKNNQNKKKNQTRNKTNKNKQNNNNKKTTYIDRSAGGKGQAINCRGVIPRPEKPENKVGLSKQNRFNKKLPVFRRDEILRDEVSATESVSDQLWLELRVGA